MWNSGLVVKIWGCESRNYGFDTGWNSILPVYPLHKRWILLFSKCVAIVATIFSLDRNETLDFRFDMLSFWRRPNYIKRAFKCYTLLSENVCRACFAPSKNHLNMTKVQGNWTRVIKFAVEHLYHWATYIVSKVDWYKQINHWRKVHSCCTIMWNVRRL